MRKEVKRSLLLWPITASATISAALMLSFVAELDSKSTRIAKKDNHVAPELLHDYLQQPVAQATVLEPQVVERSEHGARALRMPERVASMFAPHRHTSEGTVSTLLASDHSKSSISEQLLGELLVGDEPVMVDTEAITRTLQSTPEIKPPFVEMSLIEPELAESMEENRIVFSTELPKSTQVLSKPESTESTEPRILADERPIVLEPRDIEPRVVEESNQLSQDDLVNLQPPILSTEQPSPASEMQIKETPSAKPDRVAEPLVETSLVGWPITKRIHVQLDELVNQNLDSVAVRTWADSVRERLDALQSLPRIGDPNAGDVINQLASLAEEGNRLANEIEDRELSVRWLRASYAITRRVAIWAPVWDIASSNEPTSAVSDEATPEKIGNAIAAVKADLAETGDQEGWIKYLLLEEILSSPKLEERSVLAQRVLSRLQWHGLVDEHRQWLDRDSVNQFATSIQPWARDAVDYASLLNQVELQEGDSVDPISTEIAAAIQTLRFAQSKKANLVADALNAHYRNANVRMAISQPMLERILPSVSPKRLPVRTTMFGSKIRGISRIEADLRIALRPSPDRWLVSLQTLGQVHTSSTGFNGPVAVRTLGNSTFVASTPIEVTARGVQVGNSSVSVQGQTRLRNVRTDYDGWPLVGSLVRGIAENRYQELSGQSNRFANQKIKTQVSSQIKTEVDQRLEKATKQIGQALLGPLAKLELDPQVLDMQTTEDRLSARYRLAGDRQLAANTPRPRAPRTSLMSLQVHQSAINNTLERLVPRGEAITIQDLIQQGGEAFGQAELSLPDDIPSDVSIQFSKSRPVSVEIEDGIVWVTLRIVRLRKGERLNLTKFVVRAAYKAQVDGIKASLVRDGHLRISGPGMSMRERLPVRAIFTKVLSPNHPIALTLPQLVEHPVADGLMVSQLEIRDGWIGLAISENHAPRVALVKSAKRR